jgi:hypothetical protein
VSLFIYLFIFLFIRYYEENFNDDKLRKEKAFKTEEFEKNVGVNFGNDIVLDVTGYFKI